MCKKGPFNKKYPGLFIELGIPPKGARKESLRVYRALPTRKVERKSFLPTYISDYPSLKAIPEEDKKNPSTFSLSVFSDFKDIKRFAKADYNNYKPFKIAVGQTDPECGEILPTKERSDLPSKKRKTSHIDWWLYQKAKPQRYFELIEDLDEYILENNL